MPNGVIVRHCLYQYYTDTMESSTGVWDLPAFLLCDSKPGFRSLQLLLPGNSHRRWQAATTLARPIYAPSPYLSYPTLRCTRAVSVTYRGEKQERRGRW